MEKYTLLKKRRKTLSMRLDKDGNLTVSAPLTASKQEIDAFVLSHADWIERKRAELFARAPLPKITFTLGEKIPLFGEEYPLQFWSKRSVKLQYGMLFLPQSNPKKALIGYYRNALKERIFPLLECYSQKMNVVYGGVKINSARTRWGSCSGKDTLNFSYRLAMCDVRAVEYVVVHELCHILHKNHSKVFWNAVEKQYPTFQRAKQYLKEKAYFMEIL